MKAKRNLRIFRPKKVDEETAKKLPPIDQCPWFWCRDMRLPITPTEKRALLALCLRCGPWSDLVFASLDTLSDDVGGISKSVMRADIDRLVKRGYVARTRLRRASDLGYSTSAYLVLWRLFCPTGQDPRIVEGETISSLIGYDGCEIGQHNLLMHGELLELLQQVAHARGQIGPLDQKGCIVKDDTDELSEQPFDVVDDAEPGAPPLSLPAGGPSACQQADHKEVTLEVKREVGKQVASASEVGFSRVGEGLSVQASAGAVKGSDPVPRKVASTDAQATVNSVPSQGASAAVDVVAGAGAGKGGKASTGRGSGGARAKPGAGPSREELFSPEFLAFWASYPRKDEKGRAAKAFAGLTADARRDAAQAVPFYARRLAEKNKGREPQYREQPRRAAEWLIDMGWEDFLGEIDAIAAADQPATVRPINPDMVRHAPADLAKYSDINWYREQLVGGANRHRLLTMAPASIAKQLDAEYEAEMMRQRNGRPLVTMENMEALLKSIRGSTAATAPRHDEREAAQAKLQELSRRSPTVSASPELAARLG